MLNAIRKRVTAPAVLAVLALVLAMSGGAWAAKRYLITSTKQISPAVLRALRGASGRAGPAGPPGPAGAPGAGGKEGPVGKEGQPGKEGKEGKEGREGQPGREGKTGFTDTLPSGKTETGTWAESSYGLIETKEVRSAISFPIPLALAEGETGPAFYFTAKQTEKHEFGSSGCAGTLEKPTAPKGKLCVYTLEEEFEHVTAAGGISFDTEPGFGGPGAYIAFLTGGGTAGEPGQVVASGTWAVTAP